MKTTEDELSFKERLGRFLSHNRALGVILAAVLVLGLVGAIVFDRVLTGIRDKSDMLAEDIVSAYDDWMAAAPEDRDSADLDALIEKAQSSYPRFFAAQRALFTKGLVALEKEEWQDAADAFRGLADRWPDSYLAPVSLFNAGSAYEELGNYEEAERAWNDLVQMKDGDVPDAPEAYFNLGRIAESRSDTAKALERYGELESRFPDSRWTDLAKSRILIIGSRQ